MRKMSLIIFIAVCITGVEISHSAPIPNVISHLDLGGRLGVLSAAYVASTGQKFNLVLGEIPDIGTLKPEVLRTNLSWGCVAPLDNGQMLESCSQLKMIKRFSEAGLILNIVINTKAQTFAPPGNFWATDSGFVQEPGIAYAPNDLTDEPGNYGYSERYYRFLQFVFDYFKNGQISVHSVTIENEANDSRYFVGIPEDSSASMQMYVKMVKTALQAAKDSGFGGFITDSGIQERAVDWCILNELIDKNPDTALAHFRAMKGKTASIARIKKVVAVTLKNSYRVAAARYLIEETDLYQCVDVLNFHSYRTLEALPVFVAYLRAHIPAGKPIMSNEIGVKGPYTGDQAAQLMAQKYAALLHLTDGLLLWFPTAGAAGAHAGAIISNDLQIVPQTAQKLKMVLDLFSGTPAETAFSDGNTSSRISYSFEYTDRFVTAEWLKAGWPPENFVASESPEIVVYDVSGAVVPAGGEYTMRPDEVFVTVTKK